MFHDSRQASRWVKKTFYCFLISYTIKRIVHVGTSNINPSPIITPIKSIACSRLSVCEARRRGKEEQGWAEAEERRASEREVQALFRPKPLAFFSHFSSDIRSSPATERKAQLCLHPESHAVFSMTAVFLCSATFDGSLLWNSNKQCWCSILEAGWERGDRLPAFGLKVHDYTSPCTSDDCLPVEDDNLGQSLFLPDIFNTFSQLVLLIFLLVLWTWWTAFVPRGYFQYCVNIHVVFTFAVGDITSTAFTP